MTPDPMTPHPEQIDELAREIIAEHAPEGEISTCRICGMNWPCRAAVVASNWLEDRGTV